ncbi:MAG: cation:dicarboxylase symporter family transporter [Oscillospiraceae bacterium]|nr:cation:dicarboxylase symporter family transporter [Oscillospiraceae bacterium]
MELNTKYKLSNQSVDVISEKVAEFLTEIKTESKNLLRIRLSIENILLDWQQKFSDRAECTVSIGKRFGKPFIQLEVAGESCNPLDDDAENFGTYQGRLLANMGLFPTFAYERGVNKILFKLKRPKANPLVGILIAVVLAAAAGFIGTFLPEGIKNVILTFLLTPIYDTFFNILGAIAGPMVFLSVAWGIYGIGDTYTFGRIGKKMIIHFLSMVSAICIGCVLLSLAFFDLNLSLHSSGNSQLYSLFEMLLGFFPSDIVSPFLDGNSMQIILLGIAVGVSMLILGKQTEVVAQAIEQINYILQFLMELISTLVPSFIFIVLVQMIWSDTLSIVLSAWKPLVFFVLTVFITSAALILAASLRSGASPMTVLKKGLPTFIIGTTTASSVATFGTCITACEKKLGVSDHITGFGVPLGIVMFPPATAMYFIIICIHTAEVSGVECSLSWFVLAIFTACVLAIAAPPIPGGTLTCYTIMFMQLGLPEEALVVALALDVLCDFLATGANMFCLQMELVIQGKNMGLLDEKVLAKP